ncbi:MAG: N-6 DNA methylase [Armatimonadetes bacterium]|nr:N-6 DNA methylase [Armatimonadota bacterium]
MEKAEDYGATAVFFEAGRDGRPPLAQAFVFVSDGPAQDQGFARLHQRLWSWGGVPLVYRVTPGLVQLFRCAHKADFESKGEIVFKPYKTLKFAAEIANDPWWDSERLRSGTLWDEPEVCKTLLSGRQAAQKTLIKEVKLLHEELDEEGILPKPLRRKLLILSLLIAYLEARRVFEADYFARFRTGATRFFEVLADGPALVKLLEHLEERFNGHVFCLSEEYNATLRDSRRLARFARLVEGKQESGGQLTLWQRYSFADLPIELISHIYQLFVSDTTVAVYTPPFLVRLMLGEVLSWERLDRLDQENEIILDPACGSGVFLVEAYKRLVLHWRSRNDWKRPKVSDLKKLLTRVSGIDLEEGAVELAAFSLCLALCDALKPEEIRASVKLFPELKEKSIHTGCFFKCREQQKVKEKVGVVVGNPPFSSSLGTEAAGRAYGRYQENHGALPDRQLAYLFLHESMEVLAKGGVLSLLQQYNFLYNQQSLDFRRKFIERWDVREVLDFISIRGLFQKGGADTKVVVVVAEANQPSPERQILHASFRRSGRADAEQGFDIDYYDMHWLPRELALTNDGVWRSDLLGGGRVLGFVDRLKEFKTLGQFAEDRGWDCGEGFIVGQSGNRPPADHLTGADFLPSEAILPIGIDRSSISKVTDRLFKTAYTPKRYTPPMVLIREQMDLDCGVWLSSYLTYKNKVVGVCGSPRDAGPIREIEKWLRNEQAALRAFVAAISVRLFTQKATTLSEIDVLSLPYPEQLSLKLSSTEQILVDDIVDYYRDLIRLGDDSPAMKEPGVGALPSFNDTYTQQINAIYKKNKLRTLEPHTWPGVICQPFVFGKGKVAWNGAEELKGRLDKLLREQRGSGLTVTRIARIYDGPCIYLLKPDRLRYWLRSLALRDADETLTDLWEQGF